MNPLAMSERDEQILEGEEEEERVMGTWSKSEKGERDVSATGAAHVAWSAEIDPVVPRTVGRHLDSHILTAYSRLIFVKAASVSKKIFINNLSNDRIFSLFPSSSMRGSH
jgi:hypothetical protein